MHSDPIADMLTRIRNASLARHTSVTVPFSKINDALLKIMKDEGFVRDFAQVKSGNTRGLRIHLIYDEQHEPAINGLQRVSKPSLRIYQKHDEMPRVYGGIGTAIVSTPKGIMTGRQAWRDKVGGEVLCVVW
ncbi:MAG: 30S ribosomal protein S8 [Chloroflexi bacterium]|nr:30S ribosomal protein S8 [Chloroflexota bacterium]